MSQAAIVGVGNTDYAADYRDRGTVRTADQLAIAALGRAIADCQIPLSEVDGLVVTDAPGGGISPEEVCRRSGIAPGWIAANGSLAAGMAAVEAGLCTTAAVLYASAQRSGGERYGGPTARPAFESYYYYHPWGFSSQAAHWALMYKHYQLRYGTTEADLGAIAIAICTHASKNPDAVRQTPATVEDYLSSRYVCEPLRVLDLCLVNDAAVAIIVRRLDRSSGMVHPPVIVAGTAEADAGPDVAQLRSLVLDHHFSLLRDTTDRCLAAAGMARRELGHLLCYDPSTANVLAALEGTGLCRRGEGLDFVRSGGIDRLGPLPTNTSGGMLSESYSHGWNHTVEAVRQLRHEAGARQVPNLEASLFVNFSSVKAGATIYRRADG
jgi:acetyl-CoA acetyltransferase